MKRLEDLKPSEGSKKGRTRRGRGYGSGTGGHESGRGTKGQNARSGGKPKVGFEGGQTPIWRRFPKVGFHNPNKKDPEWVNVSELNRYSDGDVIDPDLLKADGLIGNPKDGLKILGDGALEKELTVKAHSFSSSARAKIEGAGGKAVELHDKE
ncbi:50S ribosomal protein L15 [Candidatus Bipolaricaulota bacterium]|nr:50S ribosomal protein L15 [Candidatus Bipolaricaulota bacterium]